VDDFEKMEIQKIEDFGETNDDINSLAGNMEMSKATSIFLLTERKDRSLEKGCVLFLKEQSSSSHTSEKKKTSLLSVMQISSSSGKPLFL
jgi:hypothetical protein